MILVPDRLLEELAPDDIDSIVLHELAHLRRGDDWINAVERIAQAALFFSPGILWLVSQLDLEREVACDDWVLQQNKALPYATLPGANRRERFLAISRDFGSGRVRHPPRNVGSYRTTARVAPRRARAYVARTDRGDDRRAWRTLYRCGLRRTILRVYHERRRRSGGRGDREAGKAEGQRQATRDRRAGDAVVQIFSGTIAARSIPTSRRLRRSRHRRALTAAPAQRRQDGERSPDAYRVLLAPPHQPTVVAVTEQRRPLDRARDSGRGQLARLHRLAGKRRILESLDRRPHTAQGSRRHRRLHTRNSRRRTAASVGSRIDSPSRDRRTARLTFVRCAHASAPRRLSNKSRV